MATWIFLLAVAWLSCAALTHAVAFAHFQRARPTFAECDYRVHLGLSLAMGLVGGPVGLPVVLALTGCRHGMKLW